VLYKASNFSFLGKTLLEKKKFLFFSNIPPNKA